MGAAVEVVVEVPRGGFAKRDERGRVDFWSPLPCPYNYGRVPGSVAPDGAPLDVVLLGPRRPRGARVTAELLGIIDFVDGGLLDPKLVAAPADARVAPAWSGLDRFFRVYAALKRCLAAARGRRGETMFRGWTRHPVSRGREGRAATVNSRHDEVSSRYDEDGR
ncbi:MAG: inorganic diphosphatase [Myxococcales bacterium]|nr:inorganic diphosphatase [Myxococcales bacterium]MCB9751144.1 inorganic diphosphatase [Myxococcales bacterium]